MSETDTLRNPDNIVDGDDEPSREELLKVIAEMTADWTKLNEWLIATAHEYHWCSDFEVRLQRYNKSFTRLSLAGRAEKRSTRPDSGCCCASCIGYPITPRIETRMQQAVTPQRLTEELHRVLVTIQGAVSSIPTMEITSTLTEIASMSVTE